MVVGMQWRRAADVMVDQKQKWTKIEFFKKAKKPTTPDIPRLTGAYTYAHTHYTHKHTHTLLPRPLILLLNSIEQ